MVRTWCTPTDQGRRVAREAARTLNPHLQEGERVLHMTVDPRKWQPLVDPFTALVKGARKTVPSAERRGAGARPDPRFVFVGARRPAQPRRSTAPAPVALQISYFSLLYNVSKL